MEVVASLSQGRTAAAQCGLFTHKSVPVMFEPPCILYFPLKLSHTQKYLMSYRHEIIHIQGVPGGIDKTSGECSLC